MCQSNFFFWLFFPSPLTCIRRDAHDDIYPPVRMYARKLVFFPGSKTLHFTPYHYIFVLLLVQAYTVVASIHRGHILNRFRVMLFHTLGCTRVKDWIRERFKSLELHTRRGERRATYMLRPKRLVPLDHLE